MVEKNVGFIPSFAIYLALWPQASHLIGLLTGPQAHKGPALGVQCPLADVLQCFITFYLNLYFVSED